jgi:hypothetical protein
MRLFLAYICKLLRLIKISSYIKPKPEIIHRFAFGQVNGRHDVVCERLNGTVIYNRRSITHAIVRDVSLTVFVTRHGVR